MCSQRRILRYYHQRGHDITGFDFIDGVIQKLKKIDASLRVEVGDITNLQYKDESFRSVLAFGLYHNLESGLERAIQKTFRVLERGGKLCASFRADNIQTRLSDWLQEHCAKKKRVSEEEKEFHKLNLTRSECVQLFERAGFIVQSVYPVENMPILYKFSFFRAGHHKVFDENKGRKEGYQLSRAGNVVQGFLMRFFAHQFCNVYVLIGEKPV